MNDCYIIEVLDIDSSVSKKDFHLYFTSWKHGEEIVGIYYKEGSGNALIMFTDAEGAKKFWETQPHILNDCKVALQKREILENEVLVKGISSKTTTECLMLYMELLSNYLVVQDIKYIDSIESNKNDSVDAIVIFYNIIDSNKIAEALEKHPTLDDKDITIVTSSSLRTIILKDIPESATYDDVLKRLNNEHDGFGEVERIQLELDKKTALVKFKFSNAAKQAVDSEIKILGEIVQAEFIDTETGIWKNEPGTVLVSGLPEGTTENHLRIHFQKKINGGGEIEKVTILPGDEGALVYFEEIQVAKRVGRVEQVFRGKLLDIKFIPRSVYVSELPEEASENDIRNHFNEQKNGGGKVQSVSILSGNKSLVVFEDPEVARRVVSTPQFMDGKLLTVTVQQEEYSLEPTMTKPSETEVQWNKSSEKHASKLEELVELLKTDPSKATRIGTYRVCFDEKFNISKGTQETKVYVGLSDDGYEVAIKCINPQKCGKMGDNEKRVLNCPGVRGEKHIVNYRFYQEVDPSKAHLVLDLHEENLKDYVKNEERTIEQLKEDGPHIIRQILSGVKTLHCCEPEILHRDLKPSNILVNLDGEMLLADFGISRILPKPETTYKSGVTGTEGWMAVESLPHSDDDEDDDEDESAKKIQVRYKKQSDIQVLGMLSHYILTKGKHPYGKPINRNYNISIGNFDLKKLSDPSAKDLISWMLQHDLKERPGVDQCLKHPYLRTSEENFKFLTAVGNVKEIKENNTSSPVIQELKRVHSLINWLTKIERCVEDHMNAFRRIKKYTSDAADLFRFIRNMAEHWHDKPPPSNVRNTVGCPKEYFEIKFPSLAGEVYGIIRKHPEWTSKETLKEYF